MKAVDKIKNMDNTYKYLGIAAIVAIGLGFVVYRFGKSSGKDEVQIDYVPLPKEQGELSPAESNLVRETVLKLYDSLKGWNLIWRDATPFKALAKQTDRVFVAIYNDFNNLYAKEDNGTLRDWIKADWYDSGTDAGAAVKTILDRMDMLNLR